MLWLILACGTEAVKDPLEGLTLIQEDPSDSPIDGLSEEWQQRFLEGDAAFEKAFREAEGLGPAYIRASCGSCHADDARGPGVVIKMATDPGLESELLPWGHTERPYVAGGAVTPIGVPEDARVVVSTRAPPAVFGRGYMEAISDAMLYAQASAQAEAGVVSGRVNEVPCDVAENLESDFPACTPGTTVVGRFGLKARIPTLDAFAADAYQGDMSITSPLRAVELANPDGLTDDALSGTDISLEVVNRTADYMRALAIPERENLPGIEVFADSGCAECHTPSWEMPQDWALPELGGSAPIFTDMLLHDMGEGFGDGLQDHSALSSEWRTAPLMGMRFLRNYLHDGRASTVEEAILLHGAEGSEAAFSVDLFNQLSDEDRAELIRYVEGL